MNQKQKEAVFALVFFPGLALLVLAFGMYGAKTNPDFWGKQPSTRPATCPCQFD